MQISVVGIGAGGRGWTEADVLVDVEGICGWDGGS